MSPTLSRPARAGLVLLACLAAATALLVLPSVSETSTVRTADPDPVPKNNTARLTSAV